jgi:hypothetical protein
LETNINENAVQICHFSLDAGTIRTRECSRSTIFLISIDKDCVAHEAYRNFDSGKDFTVTLPHNISANFPNRLWTTNPIFSG